MAKDLTTTMSSRGQVIIPAKLRTELDLASGTKFIVSKHAAGQLVLTKLPERSDWEKLLANIPNEDVDLDEQGHYDPKKSPNFHQWMQEG